MHLFNIEWLQPGEVGLNTQLSACLIIIHSTKNEKGVGFLATLVALHFTPVSE